MDINKLSGFTPGPWESYPQAEYVRDAKGLTICIVESNYHSIDEQDANSALIAKCPDLLELAKMGLELAELVLSDANTPQGVGGRYAVYPLSISTERKALALKQKAGE